MTVIKHDGTSEPFDKSKIKRAAQAAGAPVNIASMIAELVSKELAGSDCHVDDIHNAVERQLMILTPEVAKSYILYRQQRADYREAGSPLNKEIARLYSEVNRDNANAASKMYSVAEAATKRFNLANINPVAAQNHKRGKIYIHDLAYRNITFNCFFNPIGKMLERGFDNGVGYIRPPKRISSALALVAIILQSSQNSLFGGQGILNFDSDLAPFVDAEFTRQRQTIIKAVSDVNAVSLTVTSKTIDDIALQRTEDAVYQAMEAFVYNCNAMRSRSGAQPTFSSVNFGTDTSWQARMISRNILRAFMAGLGNGENPIFPNLCYRLKDGVNLRKGDPNFDITELAVKCVGKRIQPRFVFCDSPAYDGLPIEHIGTMGCRTAIRSNRNGDRSPDARGNLAFVTINLPFLALETVRENPPELISVFENKLRAALNDAADELLARYAVIARLKKRDIPFVADWYMGSEGLDDDDPIEPMVKNGTLSIGFIGLAECLKALVGKHHGENPNSQAYGLRIVKTIRDFTDKISVVTGLNFSTFATPAESACYTLLKACRKEFGIVEGVTDREYLTNSFHLPVSFACNAKTKIDIEAPYHLLCNAGAIFYLETERSPKFNPQGILKLLQYISSTGIVYGGVNWKHAFCVDCHHEGDFDGACPKCGSTNIKETAIVTGYLSEKLRFNDGKRAELADRIGHIGGIDYEIGRDKSNIAV